MFIALFVFIVTQKQYLQSLNTLTKQINIAKKQSF